MGVAGTQIPTTSATGLLNPVLVIDFHIIHRGGQTIFEVAF